MDEFKVFDILVYCILGLLGYLWNSLRSSIVLLFAKHDEDSDNLASNYMKEEDVIAFVKSEITKAKQELKIERLENEVNRK